MSGHSLQGYDVDLVSGVEMRLKFSAVLNELTVSRARMLVLGLGTRHSECVGVTVRDREID